MEVVTWFGSLFILVPLTVLAAWRLHRAGRGREAGFVLSALTGATALSHLVKHAVARPRPDLFPTWVSMPMDWSYPSAHAMQAAAAGLALWLVFRGRRARRVVLAIVLGCAVALVGLSRIYLQVHFPTDVLLGTIAAALWVAGLHALIVSRPIECVER
jgi:membrane-associated phospholipid phosphatase